MGFMAKMEISLCTLLVGYMVAWSGLNLKLTGTQPPEVLNRLFWMAIFWLRYPECMKSLAQKGPHGCAQLAAEEADAALVEFSKRVRS